MIDERKFRLLLIAEKDRGENESVTEAYQRLTNMIQITDSHVIGAVKLADFSQVEPAKVKRKYTRRKTKVTILTDSIFSVILDFDKTGKPWNMNKVRKQVNLSSAGISRHSKILQKAGYIQKYYVKGRMHPQWRVLKNQDGSNYVNKLDAGHAEGYGNSYKGSGNGSTHRTNSVFRQLESQEAALDKSLQHTIT